MYDNYRLGANLNLNHNYKFYSKHKFYIGRHEPDPGMRRKSALSFQGFSNLLMDEDNDVVGGQEEEDDMSHPLSHYFIASSHNTYLTGRIISRLIKDY